jgi:hypothetical protein
MVGNPRGAYASGADHEKTGLEQALLRCQSLIAALTAPTDVEAVGLWRDVVGEWGCQSLPCQRSPQNW